MLSSPAVSVLMARASSPLLRREVATFTCCRASLRRSSTPLPRFLRSRCSAHTSIKMVIRWRALPRTLCARRVAPLTMLRVWSFKLWASWSTTLSLPTPICSPQPTRRATTSRLPMPSSTSSAHSVWPTSHRLVAKSSMATRRWVTSPSMTLSTSRMRLSSCPLLPKMLPIS